MATLTPKQAKAAAELCRDQLVANPEITVTSKTFARAAANLAALDSFVADATADAPKSAVASAQEQTERAAAGDEPAPASKK